MKLKIHNEPHIGSVLFLLTLSLEYLSTISYIFSAYEIRDLEADGLRFAADTIAWGNSGLYVGVTQPYSQCGSSYIIGGYQVLGLTGKTASGNHYFQRIFTNLPIHNRIYFTFQLWMLDTWESDDIMEIKFDSITFNGWNLLISSFSSLTNMCGGTSKDLAPMKLSGSIAHNVTSLTFKVVAKTNETTIYESFGLRDINLLFTNSTTTGNNTICGNAPIALPSQQCPCPEGQYKSTSNICQTCHLYCASCFGPLATQCYQCKEGFSFNGTGCSPCYTSCATCNGPTQNQCTSCKSGYILFMNTTCVALASCTSPLVKSFFDTQCGSPCPLTSFVHWNGVCSATCGFPLRDNTLLLNAVKYCQYPCTIGQYLYWNGSCLSACPSPLKYTTMNGKPYCVLPCTNPNDFLYWNGTCSSTCGAFLTQTIAEGVVKVCQFPCTNNGEFLYWDGSCRSGCLTPFISVYEGGKPYCRLPCASTDYLYLDGTCSSNPCQSPRHQVTLASILNVCVSACDATIPYLYWNDICMGNCLSPLQPSMIYGFQTCNSPCNNGEFLYWNGTCKTNCNSPLSQRTDAGVQYCDYTCSSASEYLFWNGSCKTVCPSPFKSRTEASKLYCDLPCNQTEFFYWNGSCLASCSNSLVHTVQDSVNMCEYPCSSTQFLYWDGTCRSSCSYPLKPRLENTKNYCDLPCSTNDFLYWDGSCLNSCDFPLTNRVLNDVKLCEYPCLASQYLYWNGTCSEICQSFYVAYSEEGQNFCLPHCPLHQAFFAETSACMDSCPSGFFNNSITKLCQECEVSLCDSCPEDNQRKCLHCKPSAIMDVNDTCKKCESLKVEFVKTTSKYHQYRLRLTPSSCDLDLKTVQSIFKVNLETQQFSSHYFEITKLNKNLYQANLILTASLLATKEVEVALSYLNTTMKVPKTLVSQQSLQKFSESGKTAQATLASVLGASLGGTLAVGAAAALWSILSFQQFVGNFAYINVDLPLQVKLFLSLFQSISWNILPNPLASVTSGLSKEVIELENELNQYHPPKKFMEHDIKSFFIENAGSIIATNALLLFILFVVLLLKKLPGLRNSRILKKMKVHLRWNIILRTFLENGIPLSLAIFLQIRTLSFDNAYIIICQFFAVASAIYVIVMITFIFITLYKRNNFNLDRRVVRKQYGTLYEGMVLGTTYGKYYHLLILLRGILIAFLVTFFENMPLLQSSLLIYFNIGLIYFLFTKASFVNIRLNLINRVKEILILVGEFCVLFLQFNLESHDYYNIIGWIMVGALASALLIELLYTIIIQLLEIRTIIKKLMNCFKGVVKWLSRPPKPDIKVSVFKRKNKALTILGSKLDLNDMEIEDLEEEPKTTISKI